MLLRYFFCVHIVILRLPEATLSVETDAKVTKMAEIRVIIIFSLFGGVEA